MQFFETLLASGVSRVVDVRLNNVSQLAGFAKKHDLAYFLDKITARRIETNWAGDLRDGDCLLCSEDKPQHCHRRLVAEYLAARRGDLGVQHLG